MEYKVHVEAGKEDCYWQYVHPGATLFVSAQVLKGNNLKEYITSSALKEIFNLIHVGQHCLYFWLKFSIVVSSLFKTSHFLLLFY